MTTNPFATPATPSGIDYKELNGALLLITVHGLETEVKTSLGEKDAVRADVAILDGAQAGDEITDALVFPRVLISQLRSRVGQKVLGRLGQGVAKPGQNAPWLLAEATEADKQIGLAYLAKGFTAPAAGGTSTPPF